MRARRKRKRRFYNSLNKDTVTIGIVEFKKLMRAEREYERLKAEFDQLIIADMIYPYHIHSIEGGLPEKFAIVPGELSKKGEKRVAVLEFQYKGKHMRAWGLMNK